MGDERLWALDEAESALPRVRAWLASARRRLSAMRDVEAHLRDLRTVWGEQVLSVACPDHEEFLGHVARFQECRDAYLLALEPFVREGIEVKDVEAGLVDFRGRLGARTVYLCWRDGEAAIRFYHDLDAGFPGRKPIPAIGGP
jgi:hypothetical protein